METPEWQNKPTVIFLIGMAGTGKTTVFGRLFNYLHTRERKRVYAINLDPAVTNFNHPVHIDIRDTVDYKKVMIDYQHGPNGAIMTCMNLFATKFDQVLDLLKKREEDYDFILIDTPGQIEVFNWSASGTIITEAMAMNYPALFCYIVDTPRCSENPISFMSNLIYSTSILYRHKLPFTICFNKTDVCSAEDCMTYLVDNEALLEALNKVDSYHSSFAKSMSLVLDEFYKNIDCVGISATTGEGCDDLTTIFEKLRIDYFESYLPYLEERKKDIKKYRERLSMEKAHKIYEETKLVERSNDGTAAHEKILKRHPQFEESDEDSNCSDDMEELQNLKNIVSGV